MCNRLNLTNQNWVRIKLCFKEIMKCETELVWYYPHVHMSQTQQYMLYTIE